MVSINHDPRAVNPRRTPSHTELYGNPITVQGRVSGFYMERTHEYYRKVDGSRHFLRKPPAITSDVAALSEAERLGADRVRIVDSETGNEYTCIIAVIRDYGFTVDRGYGRQIALTFPYWIRTAPDGTVTPPTLPKQPKPQPEPATQQPALFEMPAERRNGGAY